MSLLLIPAIFVLLLVPFLILGYLLQSNRKARRSKLVLN